MKKIFSLSVLFLWGINAYSQLYVSSNSYVFVKNQYVFVNQDIDLQNNGFFYLRNEGQLLQGTSAASANKGLGKLSVFQEGTSDNFDYNYWCSPVGNASAAVGNENFGISMFHVPTTNINSNPANIALYNYNGASSNGSLSIAAYWIWRYLSGTNYSEWIQSGATTNISAGQGFTMKGTAGTDVTDVGEAVVNNPGSAQRYDFRGKPNDGNISV
ncbi:MAG: secretion protein, partial [Bacteroidota bacterium]